MKPDYWNRMLKGMVRSFLFSAPSRGAAALKTAIK